VTLRILRGLALCSLLLAAGCQTPATSTKLQATSLIINGIRFYFSVITPDQLVVVSTGSGKTEQEATDRALVEAVKQSMGVLIVSEISVSGDTLLSELAGAYSSGVVKSYKKLGCKGEQPVSCRVEAVVTPWAVRNALEAEAAKSKIDGKSLYGDFVTRKAAILQRKKLASYYVGKIRSIGLKPSLSSIEVLPSAGRRAQLMMQYSIKWDLAFRKELISFFKKLAKDSGGDDLCYRAMNSRYFGQSGMTNLDVLVKWGLGRGCRWFADARYIRTFDRGFAMLLRKGITDPISVFIRPFGICDRFSPYNNVLQMAHRQSIRRRLTFEVKPEQLREIDIVTLETGCPSTRTKMRERKARGY
jgi:hypothetical protein